MFTATRHKAQSAIAKIRVISTTNRSFVYYAYTETEMKTTQTKEIVMLNQSTWWFSSRNLNNDFPYSATADHFFIRLEDVFEVVRRVNAVTVLDLS